MKPQHPRLEITCIIVSNPRIPNSLFFPVYSATGHAKCQKSVFKLDCGNARWRWIDSVGTLSMSQCSAAS